MPSLADAHAALLRIGALQFDLPLSSSDEGAARMPPLHLSLGNVPVSAAWAVLGLAVLAVLAAVAVHLRDRPPTAPHAPASSPQRPGPAIAPARVRVALADGDRLAAEGRFLEAVRALLACGIGFVADHHPDRLPPTATSRDIAGDAALPEPLRDAFGRIAATVERGLFAGRPLDAADYRTCRAVFAASAMAGAA